MTALRVLIQRIAATHCANFSAGVSYCKVFLGHPFSCLATALDFTLGLQMVWRTANVIVKSDGSIG